MAAGASVCASQLTAVRKSCVATARAISPASSGVELRSLARVTVSSPFLTSGVHASSSSLVFIEGKDCLVAAAPRPVHSRKRGALVVRGLFGLGVPELVVIAGVVALVFGPKKLPELGKSLGKTVKSFQEAAKEFESEVKTSTNEFQAEVQGSHTEATPVEAPKAEAPATTTSSSEKDTA